MRKFTIGIAAGGTLGHIYPTLAILENLRYKTNYRIIFIASLKDQSYDFFTTYSHLFDQVYYLDVEGFNKYHLLRVVRKSIKAIKSIKQIIKKENIDLMIGFGGYVSGISLYGALKLNIKTFIHEQNATMGLANKLLLSKVDQIYLAIDIKLKSKYQVKTKVIGNPQTDRAHKFYIRNRHYIKNNTLLITSGTLGSKAINELAIEMINSNLFNDYQITLITGKRYYDDVIKRINKDNSNINIIPFTNQMFNYYINNKYIICRAGATTIFELIGFMIPPILIPSPNVTKHHQEKNAQYFYKLGLSEVINEQDLSINTLKDKLTYIEFNYNNYQTKIKDFINNSPSKTIYEDIITILEGTNE